MPYIGSQPTKVVSQQSSRVYRYTATAGQTVFSGADVDNQVLNVTPSDVEVHMNGLLLDATDYTVTSSSVTLVTAANAGDELTITGMVTFEVADTYDKTTADARYVNASGDTITGALTFNAGSANLQVRHDGPNAVIDNYGANANTLFYNGGSNSTGIFRFHRASDNSDAFTIDSAGRVTMPYQPAFYAGFASGSANSYVTTYLTPKVNVGNHFNSTTGLFTAPVAGRYLFTAAVMTSAEDNPYHYFYFYKNSSAYSSLHHTHSDSTEGYRHSSGSVIMDMSANDTCRLYVAASRPYQSNSNPWSSFGGYLIG